MTRCAMCGDVRDEGDGFVTVRLRSGLDPERAWVEHYCRDWRACYARAYRIKVGFRGQSQREVRRAR